MQFFTRMSIPLSTYLSMSLYLLANQWVAAADLGAARLAKRRLEKDNAEAHSALRFAEKKKEISPQSARRAQSRGERQGLARRGIGDFTKDGGAAGAGGGGDIARAMVKSLIR